MSAPSQTHATTGKCWCGYITGRMAAFAAKKPEEIQAWRVPVMGENNTPDENGFSIVAYVDECIELADWCGGLSHMMCNSDEKAFAAATVVGPHMVIPTLEGDMIARPGSLIICGVQGEFYPCDADIFAQTYEDV